MARISGTRSVRLIFGSERAASCPAWLLLIGRVSASEPEPGSLAWTDMTTPYVSKPEIGPERRHGLLARSFSLRWSPSVAVLPALLRAAQAVSFQRVRRAAVLERAAPAGAEPSLEWVR